MNRTILWLPIVAITFLIGAGFVVIYRFENEDQLHQIEIEVSDDRSCNRSISFPGRSIRISALKNNDDGFVPKEAFLDGIIESAEYNAFLGSFLREMMEESFLKTTSEYSEAYRFLWLRTFDHPVVVRVQKDGNSLKLVSRELDGMGGYEPGKLLRTDNLWLTDEQWCTFENLLEKTNYWNMTPLEDDFGNDGSRWILEGVSNGRYHIVDRWSPRGGDYRAACLYLLKLSGRNMNVLGKELY